MADTYKTQELYRNMSLGHLFLAFVFAVELNVVKAVFYGDALHFLLHFKLREFLFL